MTIDFEQLRRDKDVMRRALPADDNEAWEAWDRISTVLYEGLEIMGHDIIEELT